MVKLSFSGRTLHIGKSSVELEHTILEACMVDELVAVLFDWMEFPKYSAANNLIGLTCSASQG